MRILALGDALVDLVCERPVAAPAEAPAFVPRPGGAAANAAIAAARLGARVALVGGAGADSWGAWFRDRLRAEQVDTSLFELLAGARTPMALVTAGPDAEPAYEVLGPELPRTAVARREALLEAVEAGDALFLSSNALVDEEERAVVLELRERALELERPVLVDPNVRLGRWPTGTRAAVATRELVPGALLVRCNRPEAELLTGEAEPVAAAEALLAAGARHVVVSDGPRGAVLRGGRLRVDAPGVAARAVDTSGAGDALTGTLLARLALSGFYPPALAAALPEAVQRAARVTERFGADPG